LNRNEVPASHWSVGNCKSVVVPPDQLVDIVVSPPPESPTMTFRTAEPADIPALVTLALAFRDHLERPRPTRAEFETGVARLIAAPDAEFCLAFQEGQPVGYALLRFRPSLWATGLEATLEDLFVGQESRGHGLGRGLVGFALERARGRGCVTVCLDTNEKNLASTRIYRSFGFDDHSRRWGGSQRFFRLSLEPPCC
jgi:GNAT superfamily N-acetyltransferase